MAPTLSEETYWMLQKMKAEPLALTQARKALQWSESMTCCIGLVLYDRFCGSGSTCRAKFELQVFCQSLLKGKPHEVHPKRSAIVLWL